MDPNFDSRQACRRSFLATSASGLGSLALASLLGADGLLGGSASAAQQTDDRNPLAPKPPHFAPRAKSAIFIFLEGGPSQVELFDPKPLLNKKNGQKMPDSILKDVEFAFIDKKEAVLKGTGVKFQRAGRAGIEYSNLVPHIASCADDICLVRTMVSDQFNHHPGQLLLHTGKAEFGRPTIGSWLLYGLGSASQNLPGYVVLNSGRGASGSTSNWSSGFLPSTYQGVPFRAVGDPLLNLANPAGIDDRHQRRALDAIARLNGQRYAWVHDPEIASRISQYELAFRMQSSAPELVDLAGESQQTLERYGVDRPTPHPAPDMQPGDTYRRFATNCLLARRMVERGVRFVSLIHASWDQHASLKHDLQWNARAVDQPVAALIKDLKQRGLLDETLVIWGSEFGRTPLGQGNDGRDHHPHAFSMWMAGGGVKGGYVHGQTDDIGWAPVRDAVQVNDFQATLLHLFGLDHKRLNVNFKGLPARLTNLGGNVVRELLA
ncbi:MAG TPA: DUF1501 domain-containing protein [Pirellulales bacterium]|nr:DUF1501 domain-containing protein [Pirellulales bacterium]